MLPRKDQDAAALALLRWFATQDIPVPDAATLMLTLTGQLIRAVADNKSERKRGLRLASRVLRGKAKKAKRRNKSRSHAT